MNFDQTIALAQVVVSLLLMYLSFKNIVDIDDFIKRNYDQNK